MPGAEENIRLRESDHVILLETILGYPNPFVRPADEITTEDEALAAVMEYSDCYAISFEAVLLDWRSEAPDRSDPPQIRRIKEVLWKGPRKAT
jgi:hypothetical protein